MSSDGRSPGAKDDDAAAFALSIEGTRKLERPKRVSPSFPAAFGGSKPGKAARSPAPRARTTVPVAPTARGAVSPGCLIIEEVGGAWAARADGVDRRVLRKLRDRAIAFEARVDLHGQTRDKAAGKLAAFLATERAAGRRCLLVVHGRGLHSGPEGPALRDLVRERLTSEKHAGALLACVSAPDAWGGAGATLVYLRR